MEVRVFATPDLAEEDTLREMTVTVIDVLRMTSVAAMAIANGCAGIKAVAGVAEARDMAQACGALLGGERHALKIEGFDFSNSPLEYTPERIRGQRLVMTTSNGTLAILKANKAKTLMLGALVNADAVVRKACGAQSLGLMCAGTLGAFTLEDALAAGAIIRRLQGMGQSLKLDDLGLAAAMLYDAARSDLHAALKLTAHYTRLKTLGFEGDLEFCLREDCLDAVPTLGADGWFS